MNMILAATGTGAIGIHSA